MIEESLTAALREAWPNVKVFPVSVPEDESPPFAAYREIDITDDDSVAFEIDACAVAGVNPDAYRQNKQMAEAIREHLRDGFAYAGGCVTQTDVSKRQDHVDNVSPMYWTRAQYTMKLHNDQY